MKSAGVNKTEEHLTNGEECWCFPEYEGDKFEIIIHHSAKQLAEIRREDARRFRKVAQMGLKNPELAKSSLEWVEMQCHYFILGED